MEQARLFLAIGLSLLIFFLWSAFFGEKQPPQQAEQPKAQKSAAVQSPTSPTPPDPKPLAQKPDLAGTVRRPEPAKSITVDAPLYRLELSEKGGVLTSFVLKNYRESAGENAPLKELIGKRIPGGSLQMGFVDNGVPGVSDAVFTTDFTGNLLSVKDSPRSLTLQWVSDSGVAIQKVFQFFPDTYLIGLSVSVKNGSDRPIQQGLTMSLQNVQPEEAGRFGFEGPSALIGKKVETVKPKEIKEKNMLSGEIRWMAVQDRYFMSGIVPKNPAETRVELSLDPEHILTASYVQPVNAIPTGGQQQFDYELFFGPKSVRVLKSIGRGLDKAVDFGMFDFIAKPCLWLMNFLYSFIPNYGVAIIILTILMKVLLWPLGTKSYKSMNEMKKLQPIMAQIREKNKGDKKRMNEEIMGLYRTYKINPMGGCLPMIAQIPIFFALYRMLYEAIELRHAPFFGWINDLSAPDRLFQFGFSIPFMEPPYGIPVLTLVMGGTMFLQQKMTPAPGDPSQAKMMMLMPIVFTFIFINFSSGLVLYWLVNNVLSISQQYYISKKLS